MYEMFACYLFLVCFHYIILNTFAVFIVRHTGGSQKHNMIKFSLNKNVKLMKSE